MSTNTENPLESLNRDISDLSSNLEGILNDFPKTPMSEVSEDLLKENPLDWSVSRNRLLREAILSGDEETVNLLVDDVAHVVGIRQANLWMIDVMGKIVNANLDSQNSDI